MKRVKCGIVEQMLSCLAEVSLYFPSSVQKEKNPLPRHVYHLLAFASIRPKVWMGKISRSACACSTERQT